MFRKALFTSLLVLTSLTYQTFAAVKANRISPTTVEIRDTEGHLLTLDFYGPNIVRLFLDPNGGALRDPEATPPAKILVAQPRKDVGELIVEELTSSYAVQTSQMAINIEKASGRMDFINRRTGKKVTGLLPTEADVMGFVFDQKSTSLRLSAQPDEHFYGGGVQNGRFAHSGNIIAIENTNNWVDGGVASPTPFYWSTAGYGILWHTFRPGKYDFGATAPQVVSLKHEEPYLDFFLMIDNGCVPLLNDFYQLTGHPVLLPKFGFYEGHLNAYNRDYWSIVDGSSSDKGMGSSSGILFEDGKYYKESQKPVEGGIRESLNGELEDNYQFSARAVIDRYEKADMPLGWVLPNDGYGAGYGQTETLDGNIDNLRLFGEYARSKGVEIGLWTQSDLHPKEGVEALLQRDIIKEVRDAGVRVLKTDVAWVGEGYSFGLNGVADVGEIMPKYGNEARPFIISLDGWAGTQRYAGIWTGDQTGGEWEYIRFHLPTYIGAGLSGQPNICSDMDGIFGGLNRPVNVRDYQWKTFTPMQLNMDGWGSNAKYPQALGEPATSINRSYLKLKSELMPYAYTIAHEAIDGLPMIRPVRITGESGNAGLSLPVESTPFRYEFLYGPSILVAAIYQNTAADEQGNDIRNNIYLPEGQWVDWFTGECYEGGRIINHFLAPLWKLPVFVRRGAIIPFTAPHNNPNLIDKTSRAFLICPYGRTEFSTYDDDGRTQAYLRGESATTHILSDLNEQKNRVTITVEPTQGSFAGMEKMQKTEFRIPAVFDVKKVRLFANGKKVSANIGWAVAPTAATPRGTTSGSPRFLCVSTTSTFDITTTTLQLTIDGYRFDTSDHMLTHRGPLTVPTLLTDDFEDGAISPSAYELPLKWTPVANADYYEIEHLGHLYSTIQVEEFTLEDLRPDTNYEIRVRAVNKDGQGSWTREKLRTSPDPLRFAIHGITAESTLAAQPSQGIEHLFDFDEGTIWHTAWDKPHSTPFELTLDLHVITKIDSIRYLPRPDHGNGTFAKYSVEYSLDKQSWKALPDRKATETPVRYLRIHVEEARGGFGSGQQIYVFRNPDAEKMIPGDINHDNRIDENDLTSYMNYTGLRKGDGDFEGYISRGDLNQNGLIDAYDISNVAIELESGVSNRHVEPVAGTLTISADKKQVNAGDIVTLTVTGCGLRSVNALSFALPYDATRWEYLDTNASGILEMRNLTYDRLHSNGQKALYPTFINCGEHPTLEGDQTIFSIRFRAKQKSAVSFVPQDGMILDKYLNVIKTP